MYINGFEKSRIKYRTARAAEREDDARKTSKAYFEDLYSVDGEEQVAVDMVVFIELEEVKILGQNQ